MHDDSFEEFRGKVLEEMREQNERVMRHFFWRINYKGIVGYKNNLGQKIFTIWTDKPGILIGYRGKNVEILKEILKEEFGYERKQTLANAERFVTAELKEKEDAILHAQEKAIRLENELYNIL